MSPAFRLARSRWLARSRSKTYRRYVRPRPRPRPRFRSPPERTCSRKAPTLCFSRDAPARVMVLPRRFRSRVRPGAPRNSPTLCFSRFRSCFSRFRSRERKRDRSSRGSGLELPVARDARTHGGQRTRSTSGGQTTAWTASSTTSVIVIRYVRAAATRYAACFARLAAALARFPVGAGFVVADPEQPLQRRPRSLKRYVPWGNSILPAPAPARTRSSIFPYSARKSFSSLRSAFIRSLSLQAR